MQVTQRDGHKNWSTDRKNAVRDEASRAVSRMYIRRMNRTAEKMVLAAGGVLGFYTFVIGAVELIERAF